MHVETEIYMILHRYDNIFTTLMMRSLFIRLWPVCYLPYIGSHRVGTHVCKLKMHLTCEFYDMTSPLFIECTIYGCLSVMYLCESMALVTRQ